MVLFLAHPKHFQCLSYGGLIIQPSQRHILCMYCRSRASLSSASILFSTAVMSCCLLVPEKPTRRRNRHVTRPHHSGPLDSICWTLTERPERVDVFLNVDAVGSVQVSEPNSPRYTLLERLGDAQYKSFPKMWNRLHLRLRDSLLF